MQTLECNVLELQTGEFNIVDDNIEEYAVIEAISNIQKTIVTVCMGVVGKDCQKVLNDAGLSFETKDEVEAWSLLDPTIIISHGCCEACMNLLLEEYFLTKNNE